MHTTYGGSNNVRNENLRFSISAHCFFSDVKYNSKTTIHFTICTINDCTLFYLNIFPFPKIDFCVNMFFAILALKSPFI